MRQSIERALILAVAASAAWAAGPVEFGMSELDAAITAHGFRYKPKIDSEINLDPPETFRIDPFTAGGGRISGGDLRGLMYGLLEAAEQIRTVGHLKLTRAVPAATPRGVWMLSEGAGWVQSEEFWRRTFETMARDRFDRVRLVFDQLPNPALLHTISQMGTQYAVDVVLGLRSLPQESAPALEQLLTKCPAIHMVALDAPDPASRDVIVPVLARAGRRVLLEMPGSIAKLNFSEGASLDAIRASASAMGFEITAPTNERGEPTLLGIGLWGRLGYDPKPESSPKPAAKSAVSKTPAAKAPAHAAP